MGPYGSDAAFMGYTGGRYDDPPPKINLGQVTREYKLQQACPGLEFEGPSVSVSRRWGAWIGDVEIVEARHENYGAFLACLEARFLGGNPASPDQPGRSDP